MDKEVKPQDVPAICEYSGLRSVEGYKEETYRIREDKIDSLMDILHEIDNREKTYCHIHDRMYNEDILCDRCLEENNK